MAPLTVMIGTFTAPNGDIGGGMDMEGAPSESNGVYSVSFDPSTGTFDAGTLALRADAGAAHQIQFSWTRFCPIMAMPKPAWSGLMGWTTCLTDLADPAYITVTRSGSWNVLLRHAS